MENLKTIRIMLVDDHTMVRLGIATMLMLIDDIDLVGQASDGESAVQLCGEIKPDIVLMDMLLPGISGPQAIKMILEYYPKTRVIALTSHSSENWIREALDAGAVGYLLKDVSGAELELAIRAVASGLDALSPVVLQSLIRREEKSPSINEEVLTPREKEVLALMTRGDSNADIAKKLIVGPTTVKSHVSNILAKLHVTTRTEAVALALRQNMLLSSD